jgi:hypothetical protein
MSTTWLWNGVALSTLGMSRMRRTLVNQAVDRVTVDVAGDYTATAPAYGDAVVITRVDDGVSTTWFRGRANSVPRLANGREEVYSCEVVGIWWWFEHLVYSQVHQLYASPLATTRVILNQSATYEHINLADQITDAVDWAIARGAPVEMGDVSDLPDLKIPMEEITDITVAEVIRKQLRWAPDAVVWFDYSLTTPKFYAVPASELDESTYDLSAGSPVQSIEAVPRHDLVVPGVTIHFEVSQDSGSEKFANVTTQTAGDMTDLRAVTTTLQLAPNRYSASLQKLTTAAFPADLTDKTWWMSIWPLLDTYPPADITIISAAFRHPEVVYTRYLTEGEIHHWTGKTGAEQAVIAVMDVIDRTGGLARTCRWMVCFKCIATDAETVTYGKGGSVQYGDAIPTDMAAALLAQWNQLFYEGRLVLERKEIATEGMGTMLKVTGGPAQWSTFAGVVQRVDNDVDQGLTTLTFGPPEHLQPQDLIALFNQFRNRRPVSHCDVKATGKPRDNIECTSLSGPSPILDVSSAALIVPVYTS